MNIDNLLSQNNFEELSDAERAFVLEQMTMEAYQMQRMIVLSSQAIMEEESLFLIPNASTPNKALVALKGQQETKKVVPLVQQIFSHRIPICQAAAAALLLFLAGNWNAYQPMEVETGLLAERDTIFVEKVITDTQFVNLPLDTITRVVYKTIEKPVPVFANVSPNKKMPRPKAKEINLPYDISELMNYGKRVSTTIPANTNTFTHAIQQDRLL